MNRAAHWLSLYSGVILLSIGIPELLGIGPRFLPASWVIIYGWLPGPLEWVWAGLYVVAGAASLLGVHYPIMLRLGFRLSALAFGIWGFTSIYGWATGQGGTIPGSAAYLLLVGYGWVLAANITPMTKAAALSELIVTEAAKLPEKVQERIANGGE